MRYIGNKTKLLDFIHEQIISVCGDISNASFCDLFSGSGTVARYFKQFCSSVIANDLEDYAYVLSRNYVENNEQFEYEQLIEHLNNIPNVKGKFYQTLSPFGGRMFFTEYNAQRIDAIRQEIDKLSLKQDQYYFLLCSLIESADCHANTTGVYAAYLKNFNDRSSKNMKLGAYPHKKGAVGKVYKQDANKLIKEISGDILYLDPPYNNRQYGANYHVLNYIVNYSDFEIKHESKTALSNYNKSSYSQKVKVAEAFENLIANANYKYIFVSYNNEGILSFSEIKEIMSKYGEYNLKEKEHKRYKSNTNNLQQAKVKEHLHVLIK
jgi:adenine-specific DNA-methyltransferase